jgi:hypothetical protein
VNSAHRQLAIAIGAAEDQAKQLLTQLERQGHGQTGKSSAVYLALVVIRKRLSAVDPTPSPLADLVPDLEYLVRGCQGMLAPVKPLVEAALRIAREANRES